jgi:CopA family copper-resistance protein
VIVEPKDDRPYTIFAQSLDRSGYARGTLAPQPGMQAEVPPLDPRPLLTMIDMGMAMGQGMAGMDMSGMDMSGMKGMDHGSMKGMGHDMSNMPGMDHGAMENNANPNAHGTSAPPHHAPAEYGPMVDSLAIQPQSRLDDPGVGLRKNGRRVLTYADLHTLGGPIDHRSAGRDIELHLTGHMERFVWSFNGQKFSEAEPLRFNHGERLRLVLVNDSMMNHPIHLHGMWGEVESEKGEFLVRKHTITVQPGQRLSYWVSADALGRWAYHCHLLYHQEAGMFREVLVERSSKEGARS